MATTNINDLEKTLDDLDPRRSLRATRCTSGASSRQQRALAALIGSCMTPSARPARLGILG